MLMSSEETHTEFWVVGNNPESLFWITKTVRLQISAAEVACMKTQREMSAHDVSSSQGWSPSFLQSHPDTKGRISWLQFPGAEVLLKWKCFKGISICAQLMASCLMHIILPLFNSNSLPSSYSKTVLWLPYGRLCTGHSLTMSSVMRSVLKICCHFMLLPTGMCMHFSPFCIFECPGL